MTKFTYGGEEIPSPRLIRNSFSRALNTFACRLPRDEDEVEESKNKSEYYVSKNYVN